MDPSWCSSLMLWQDKGLAEIIPGFRWEGLASLEVRDVCFSRVILTFIYPKVCSEISATSLQLYLYQVPVPRSCWGGRGDITSIVWPSGCPCTPLTSYCPAPSQGSMGTTESSPHLGTRGLEEEHAVPSFFRFPTVLSRLQ